MAEKNGWKDALLGLAMTAVLGMAGWSLINTIELKINVAVLQAEMKTITYLLKDHVISQPMASYMGGK